MAQFNTFGETEKKDFFKKYSYCAEAAVLEMIWQALKTDVTILNFQYTQKVSDLSPIQELVCLEELVVCDTQVRDLSPLKGLMNLHELEVSGTQVTDLSPLKDLQSLQVLDISGTQVTDLSPLKDLQNLRRLLLFNTQVSDLSALKDLQNLQEIDLYKTQVHDLRPLKTMIEKGIVVQCNKLNWESLGIDIGDTPLSNPPIEIAKQGNQAILNYWKEQGV